MLAITVDDGIGFVEASALKQRACTVPVSSSLQCTASVWAPDNSQLYLASSSSIKRYTISEGLLEEIYSGSDLVSCLLVDDTGGKVFFAAASQVYMLDCTPSCQVPMTLGSHRTTITTIALSNDSSYLVSVSDSEVSLHRLMHSSQISLQGLPGSKISCCTFHLHSQTRLLLGAERQILIFDGSKPHGPTKSIELRGCSGNIIAVASSPFSKSLIAVATSAGNVILVDLDKHSGYVADAPRRETPYDIMIQGLKNCGFENITYCSIILRRRCCLISWY